MGRASGWVALLALLAGCGSAASARVAPPAQRAFLSEVHDSSADIGRYRSDTQLVQLGGAACDGFASGVSFQALADRLALEVGSLPTSDLGTVILAAADHLCPAYRSKVQ